MGVSEAIRTRRGTIRGTLVEWNANADNVLKLLGSSLSAPYTSGEADLRNDNGTQRNMYTFSTEIFTLGLHI